jgi:hypothetical protein
VNEAIAWVTFAGAWLLVAGPLYQGSVELNELDFDREGIQGKAAAVQAAQDRPSAWPVWLFWLLVVVMLAAAVLNTAVQMISNAHTRQPGNV